MALVLEIKVVPQSGKQQCQLDKAGTLKCYLKSPAQDGKANQELIKMLAKQLGLPTADVTLIAGHTGRTKMIKINAPLTRGQILEKLGIEWQLSIK